MMEQGRYVSGSVVERDEYVLSSRDFFRVLWRRAWIILLGMVMHNADPSTGA